MFYIAGGFFRRAGEYMFHNGPYIEVSIIHHAALHSEKYRTVNAP